MPGDFCDWIAKLPFLKLRMVCSLLNGVVLALGVLNAEMHSQREAQLMLYSYHRLCVYRPAYHFPTIGAFTLRLVKEQ